MKLTKLSLKKLTDSPEVGGKQPSHALIASDDKFENKTQVGKLWLKQGQYGNFLSGQLDTVRNYEGKEYQGYVLITEKEWNEYQALKSVTKGSNEKSVEVGGYTGEVADVSQIDF